MAPRKYTCIRTPTWSGPDLFPGGVHWSYLQGATRSFSSSVAMLDFLMSGQFLRSRARQFCNCDPEPVLSTSHHPNSVLKILTHVRDPSNRLHIGGFFFRSNNCRAGQQMPVVLWNPKVHHRVHKSLPQQCTMHTLFTSFLKILLHIETCRPIAK
jgi:hypothetical protein